MARLFQALVVVGSSLTLANCGGRAAERDDSGSSGGVAGASNPTSGGSLPNASTAGVESGGTANDGGTASGGYSRGGDPVTGIPPGGYSASGASTIGGAPFVSGFGGSAASDDVPSPETLAQWSCNVRPCVDLKEGDLYLPAVVVDSTCSVDPSRPQRAEDCAADEWFECQLGSWEGRLPVAVNCACTPMTAVGCQCGQGDGALRCDSNVKLCACAVTGILVK